MPKSREIVIPEELMDFLGIDEGTVNKKMQELVDRRLEYGETYDFSEEEIAKDYIDLFTKNELIAMFMHAASNAGYLEWKILQLQDMADIPIPLFEKIMELDLPDDDELMKIYREEHNQDEEQDFI